MSILIEQIKKNNPGLKYAEVEGVLYIIKNTKDLTNTKLIQLTGLPKETLKAFKSSVGNLLDKSNEGNVSLNEEGTKFLSSLELSPYKWSLFEYSDSGVENKLERIRKESQISSKREYDQFYATEQTSFAKAALLKDKGLLKGKKITLLGDDDLLSLSIPFICHDYTRIDIYDVDIELLNFIKEQTNALNIKNIHTHVYDARRVLPIDAFIGADVVITDPPYTKTGVALFLNRSVEFLGNITNSNSKYVVLYYGNSFKSPEKTIKIQELINNYGFVIEDKINKFARYNGGESIGAASSLYLLQATSNTKPKEEFTSVDKIYTYQNQKEEKFPTVEHVTIKALDVPSSIVTSKKLLFKIFGAFCKTHDLKVLQKDLTKFKGGGMSLTFILSNSNLLVHTWPEYNALHIDLLTCSLIKDKSSIYSTLEKLLKTSKIIVKNIE